MVKIERLVGPSDQDIATMIALYISNQWWGGETDNANLIRKIVEKSHLFLVARSEDGALIGMGRAISDGVSDAYIQDVTVDKRWRGQGIGRRIVRELVEELKKDKIFWVALIAEKGSQRLYEGVGFKVMDGATPMLRLELMHGI